MMLKRGRCGYCFKKARKFFGNLNRGLPGFVRSGRFASIWNQAAMGKSAREIYMNEFVKCAKTPALGTVMEEILKELETIHGKNPVTSKISDSMLILDTPLRDIDDGLYLKMKHVLVVGKNITHRKKWYVKFMRAKDIDEKTRVYETLCSMSGLTAPSSPPDVILVPDEKEDHISE
ncbi:hypothetical protein ADUPG1_006738 [Aduncisulcus paluster]|uniref:Uncharacterized protein n=1 Tax=Aduncisulcus paluster TaxID=2918883 RepID=A0ABQ5KJE1_9EUKA|nr:hypothetical protein ADUPG1_006738 [Aduncisulcus paluster]